MCPSLQVLFVSLTPLQLDLYRSFVGSNEVSEILEGRRHALAGIDVLRKICNHPDLLERPPAGFSTSLATIANQQVPELTCSAPFVPGGGVSGASGEGGMGQNGPMGQAGADGSVAVAGSGAYGRAADDNGAYGSGLSSGLVEDYYGAPRRSGKLAVAERVLEHWRAHGHKVLLFTQVRMQALSDCLCVCSSGVGALCVLSLCGHGHCVCLVTT